MKNGDDFMKRNYLFSFLAGALLYPLIEIWFRGRTHLSMSLLGGVCTLAIFWIHRMRKNGSLIISALISSLIITELEFLSGVYLNLYRHLAVWDYSSLTGNILGQVCPLFSCYWFFLSFFALCFFRSSSTLAAHRHFRKTASTEAQPQE
jgi:uncharacterized membrane protein